MFFRIALVNKLLLKVDRRGVGRFKGFEKHGSVLWLLKLGPLTKVRGEPLFGDGFFL